MIKFIFLSIPCSTTYEGLKRQQKFPEDIFGVSEWVMRFPLTIYSLDLNQKHVFRQGKVQVQLSGQIGLQQKWKYFVITNSHGTRLYCTSQLFFEKSSLLRKTNSILGVSQKFQQFHLPKSLVIISELPYFKLHVNLLKIHRELRKKIPNISCQINEKLYNIYNQLVNNNKQLEFDYIQINPQSRIIKPPIQMAFQYYVANCNNQDNFAHPQSLFIQRNTNREVLHLYKLKSNAFYQTSHYFHLPLSPNSLRVIISAILQQKQLIFASNNQNLNVMLIETLMQMIVPFKWHYMYVPNLPLHMIDAAEESFMPYIVGIQKKYLQQINTQGRVIIYVDQDRVQHNGMVQLPKEYEKYFTYSSNNNNSNKCYLEWEHQIRRMSILLICKLLSQSFSRDTVLHLNKQQRKYHVRNYMANSVQLFYEELLSKSMMFEKFVQDKHQDVFHQMCKLLCMNIQERNNYLINQFNLIKSYMQCPNIIDNQKNWIKYYHQKRQLNTSKMLFKSSKSILGSTKQSMASSKFINTEQTVYGGLVRSKNINTEQTFYGGLVRSKNLIIHANYSKSGFHKSTVNT